MVLGERKDQLPISSKLKQSRYSLLQKNGVQEMNMLRWTVVFLVTAMIVGFLEFSEMLGEATEAIRSTFIVALELFIISGICAGDRV